MSAKDLKAWMEKNNKTIIDVASLTGLSPNTVRNYLNGEGTFRSTQRLLEQIVRAPVPSPRRVAAG